MTKFIDVHCHFEDARFDSDRDEILAALPKKGVGAIIDAGCTVKDSEFVKDLAQKYDFMYFCAGIHPEYANEYSFDVQNALNALYAHPKCVGAGEIGLDFHYADNPPEKVQKDAFAMQISAAKKANLPAVIHCRDAIGPMLEMLKSENVTSGVMHCFSESRETAKFCLDRGLYFSFGGTTTFKNARRVIENLEYLPKDRVLLETDSPYLAPEPLRGTRNDSSNIRFIIDRIADIWKTDPDGVASVTSANALRLFTKISHFDE